MLMKSLVCQQWVVGENGVLKPKRVNPNVYQPPSLKGGFVERWRWSRGGGHVLGVLLLV